MEHSGQWDAGTPTGGGFRTRLEYLRFGMMRETVDLLRTAAPCVGTATPGLPITDAVLTAPAGAPQPRCASPPAPLGLHRLPDIRSRLPAPNRVTSTAICLFPHQHRTRQRPHRYSHNYVNRRVVLPIRRRTPMRGPRPDRDERRGRRLHLGKRQRGATGTRSVRRRTAAPATSRPDWTPTSAAPSRPSPVRCSSWPAPGPERPGP